MVFAIAHEENVCKLIRCLHGASVKQHYIHRCVRVRLASLKHRLTRWRTVRIHQNYVLLSALVFNLCSEGTQRETPMTNKQKTAAGFLGPEQTLCSAASVGRIDIRNFDLPWKRKDTKDIKRETFFAASQRLVPNAPISLTPCAALYSLLPVASTAAIRTRLN